jgi:hypothetical protein
MTVSSQSRSALRPAMSIGRVMFSKAVSVGTRLNVWKTNPTRSRRSRVSCRSSRRVRSTSPTSTRPASTVSSPAMQCMSVDLPEPDGPMTAMNPPRGMPTVTASSAITLASPLP